MTEEFKKHFAIAATKAITGIANHGTAGVLIPTYGVSLKYKHLTPLVMTYDQKYAYKTIAYLDALVSKRQPYFGKDITSLTSMFIALAKSSDALINDLDLAIELFQQVIGIYIHKLKTVVYEQTEDLPLSPLDSKIFDNFDIHTVSLLLSQYHLLHAYDKEDSYPVDRVTALLALERGARKFIEETLLEVTVEETPSGKYTGVIKFIKKEG